MVEFFDDIDKPLRVQHIKTGYPIKECRERFTMSDGDKRITVSSTHIMLATAFPNLDPRKACNLASDSKRVTVDHINDDPADSRIHNLEWMSRSDNARKGQIKATKSAHENGGKRGKAVLMCGGGYPECKFHSVSATAHFVMRARHLRYTANHDTTSGKIGEVCRGLRASAFGFTFNWVDTSIHEEVWAEYMGYRVSDHGRIMGKYGGIARQTPSRTGQKYSSVFVNGKREFVHRLVWLAFGGEIPPNMEILHDDTVPLVDNLYRNWLCDLRLGSHHENMIEFHTPVHGATPVHGNTLPPEEYYSCEIHEQATPTDELEYLLEYPPQYVQRFKASGGKGAMWVLSRRYPLNPKGDIKSTSSKKKSNKYKLLQILGFMADLGDSKFTPEYVNQIHTLL